MIDFCFVVVQSSISSLFVMIFSADRNGSFYTITEAKQDLLAKTISIFVLWLSVMARML